MILRKAGGFWLSKMRRVGGKPGSGVRTRSQGSARWVPEWVVPSVQRVFAEYPGGKAFLSFLGAARIEEGERKRCEESEMRACMVAAEESCSKYTRETCEPVFANMRIADPGQSMDPRFTRPFRRKRWTRGMKDEGESNADGPESGTNLKLNTDYIERVMVDQESSRSEWGGPTWSEGIPESESPSVGESSVDGWEGGLIRPKVGGSSAPHR